MSTCLKCMYILSIWFSYSSIYHFRNSLYVHAFVNRRWMCPIQRQSAQQAIPHPHQATTTAVCSSTPRLTVSARCKGLFVIVIVLFSFFFSFSFFFKGIRDFPCPDYRDTRSCSLDHGRFFFLFCSFFFFSLFSFSVKIRSFCHHFLFFLLFSSLLFFLFFLPFSFFFVSVSFFYCWVTSVE